MKLENSTKEMILGGLLYFQSVREMYLQIVGKKVAPLLSDDGLQSPYVAIERSIKNLISADVTVRYEVIMQNLVNSCRKLPPGWTTYRIQYAQILEKLDQRELYTEQLSQRFLHEVNTRDAVDTAIEELKKLKPVAEVKEVIGDLSNRLSVSEKPNKVKLYDPIAEAQNIMIHIDKVPTGISWFDTLTGGGITFGEHGGCLGPSGGGKSVIANQLACNLAIQGYNTMLLQFEQSIKYNTDITSRVYAYLTRLPTSEFKNKAYNELSEEAKEALKRCANVSSRIRFGSFIDDDVEKSVETIINTIEESCDNGFIPKFVVIDWLGAVVTDFMQAATGEDRGYQLLAAEIQDKLNAYAKVRGISMFYLHQLSTDAARKESGSKPTMYDGYFFRAFPQKIEYCLQIGTKSMLKDGRFAAWLIAGKVRGEEPGKAVVVIVDGAHATMELAKEGEFKVNARGALEPVADMLERAEGKESDVFPVTGADAFIANF